MSKPKKTIIKLQKFDDNDDKKNNETHAVSPNVYSPNTPATQIYDESKIPTSETNITVGDKTIHIHVNNLETIEKLGKGAYGDVELVKDKESGYFFAVKRMCLIENGKRGTLMEIYVAAQSTACIYTIDFYGALAVEGELWMLMEKMDTSLDKLRDIIFKNEQNFIIDESIIGNIAFQVIKGLNYLRYKVNVLHRDVKPSNILLNRNGQVKVCDFGIAGLIVNDQSLVLSNVGTKPYLAPEKIQQRAGTKGYTSRADVWSLGITILEFSTGKFPYQKWENTFQALRDVVDSPSPKLPAGRSTEFNDFIDKCLMKDVDDRPRYNDLLEMKFIKDSADTDISGFLQKYIPESEY